MIWAVYYRDPEPMVKIESNKENNFYRILIRPNQSISWKSSLVFISVIAFTCLSIGLGFAFVGATLILPFAGLSGTAADQVLFSQRPSGREREFHPYKPRL